MSKFADSSAERLEPPWTHATGCRASVGPLFVGIVLIIACPLASAQAMYRIKPLGYLGGCTSPPPYAVGFNGAGEVAGSACKSGTGSGFDAFLWKNDGTAMVEIALPGVDSYSEPAGINASGLMAGSGSDNTGNFAFVFAGDGTPIKKVYDGLGGSYASATAINDLGQLTGFATTTDDAAEHAFLWKNNGSAMVDLGSLGGSSYGDAINASGQVTGEAYLAGDQLSHAFIWKNDGTPMHDLGTLGGRSSNARSINASGQVAGNSTVPGMRTTTRAFFWSNDGTRMHDLGTLGGTESYAYALNDLGQVVGTSDTLGSLKSHAFVWMNNGTPMKDLGTLGGTVSVAYGINASGQVTGSASLAAKSVGHAFLWRNDGTKIQDLNKLIDPNDPLKPYVTLIIGHFINRTGDILADGTDSRTGLQDLYLVHGTVLTLSPRSIAFGNIPIGTKSAAKSVVMTNTSAKVVAVASIVLAGSDSGQFASTNNCGSSLVGHASCTIKVTFKPTAKGAKSAMLSVNGGGGGLRVVVISGTGT